MLQALSAVATASALTLGGPIGVPAGERPVASVPAPGGGALLVRGNRDGALPYLGRITPLSVQRLSANGAFGRVTSLSRTVLVRDRPRADGGDDLLVWRAHGRAAGRLALVRATPDGRLRTLWTASEPSDTWAGFARDARGRYAIAWRHQAREGGEIAVVTSADGRRFGARRLLRRGGRPVRMAAMGPMGVAVGAGGAPVVVATEYVPRRTGRTTILTARARDGAVTARQTFDGPFGLVSTEQDAGGRIAVLLHDTGIEGESGECVGDGHGRHVRATVSDPRTGRFAAPADLDDQAAYCPDGGAPVLLALPAGRFAVVFGAIDAPAASGDVRVALGDAHGFGPATTAWPGAELAGAVADPRDGTIVAALQDPDPRHVERARGVSLATRAPDGTLGAAQRLSATGLLTTLSAGAGGGVLAGVAEPGGGAGALFRSAP